MENDVGKVCPICNADIKEGDSVKLGPGNTLCHESCWNMSQQQAAGYAPEGSHMYQAAGYVPGGSHMYQAVGNNVYPAVNIESELQQMVGSKAEYYMPRFQEMERLGKKCSWNWAAFFFPHYWMIYRKMYGAGAFCAGILYVLYLLYLWMQSSVLEMAVRLERGYSLRSEHMFTLAGLFLVSVLGLGLLIAGGLLGNYIYFSSLRRKAIRAKSMNEPFRGLFISQNGSVSPLATILTVIGFTLLKYIPYVIFLTKLIKEVEYYW